MPRGTTTTLDGVAPGADDGVVLELVEHPAMHEVRRWTATAVPQVKGDQLDDLLLVVTELVSNAYDHGERALSLRLWVRDSRVRVEVTDTSTDPPVPGRSRIADSRGRGMVLVAALATDWGYGFQPQGKTVWAELPIDAG